jgi:[acyl-carrier-protein] S-malonyltransferase
MTETADEPMSNETIAANVDGVPVTAHEIEHHLQAMRDGPLSSRLPRYGSAQHRNMRRWVAQLLTAQLLLDHEFTRRGLVEELPTEPPRPPVSLPNALLAGGIGAAVVARSARAARVAVDVTAGTIVPEQAIREYFEYNRDRYPPPLTYGDAREHIAADLLEAAKAKAFNNWLDLQVHQRVCLLPGFEHPADPHQPDATHHH